jgi:hypothetical protein
MTIVTSQGQDKVMSMAVGSNHVISKDDDCILTLTYEDRRIKRTAHVIPPRSTHPQTVKNFSILEIHTGSLTLGSTPPTALPYHDSLPLLCDHTPSRHSRGFPLQQYFFCARVESTTLSSICGMTFYRSRSLHCLFGPLRWSPHSFRRYPGAPLQGL